MTHYTDLEKEQINELYNVTKEKHKGKYNIKDLDHITNTMIDDLHYDSRVNGIYGKKHITIGTLKKIFVHGLDDKIHHEHNMIIDNYENNIDKKLNIIEYKKNRENNNCCRSCIIC